MVRKSKSEENKQRVSNRFIYCSNRKCVHMNCIRRCEYAPWNILISVSRFEPDKNGICDGFLEDI